MPFCGARCRAYSPDSSEKYAMVLPSGDHDGDRSIVFGVLVITRASPFSAGTVTISPRASKSARVAVGDKWAPVRRLLTFTMRERTSGRSPAMRTGTGL